MIIPVLGNINVLYYMVPLIYKLSGMVNKVNMFVIFFFFFSQKTEVPTLINNIYLYNRHRLVRRTCVHTPKLMSYIEFSSSGAICFFVLFFFFVRIGMEKKKGCICIEFKLQTFVYFFMKSMGCFFK